MTKHSNDPRDHEKEAEQARQEAARNQQRAEAEEVAGLQNEGQKDHKGADKGPRH